MIQNQQFENVLLNSDICYEILQWLEFHEIICNFSLVCKTWNEISRSVALDIQIVTREMFYQLLETMEKLNSKHVNNSDLVYYNIQGLTFTFSNAIKKVNYLISIEKYFPNLTNLDVCGTDIEDSGIACLCKLKDMKKLNIASNRITPEGRGIEMICKFMKLLTNLDVSFNFLGQKAMKHILTLNNLTDLNVSSCDLDETSAQSISKMNNLIKLDISYNRLDCKCAKLISNLKNLKELVMLSIGLKEEGARYISAMKNLRLLSISFNEIGNRGAKSISSLSQLETLHIESCNILDEGIEYLSSNLKQISELKIGSKKIERKGVNSICSMNSLTNLSVSQGCLDEFGIQQITRMKNLTYLDISHNSLEDALEESIVELKSLRTLVMANNVLSTDEAVYISSLTRLTTLDIENTKSNDIHIEILSSSLHNLRNLHADSNQITSWGAKLISELMTNLESLYLNGNNIGDEGIEYLSTLKHLRVLGVCECKISDEGVNLLVNCASKNLRELLIESNDISDKGSRLIFSMPQLNSIYLVNNEIDL